MFWLCCISRSVIVFQSGEAPQPLLRFLNLTGEWSTLDSFLFQSGAGRGIGGSAGLPSMVARRI